MTSLRLDDEDRAILARLMQRYGVRSVAQMIRIAIRFLDQMPTELPTRGSVSNQKDAPAEAS